MNECNEIVLPLLLDYHSGIHYTHSGLYRWIRIYMIIKRDGNLIPPVFITHLREFIRFSTDSLQFNCSHSKILLHFQNDPKFYRQEIFWDFSILSNISHVLLICCVKCARKCIITEGELDLYLSKHHKQNDLIHTWLIHLTMNANLYDNWRLTVDANGNFNIKKNLIIFYDFPTRFMLKWHYQWILTVNLRIRITIHIVIIAVISHRKVSALNSWRIPFQWVDQKEFWRFHPIVERAVKCEKKWFYSPFWIWFVNSRCIFWCYFDKGKRRGWFKEFYVSLLNLRGFIL